MLPRLEWSALAQVASEVGLELGRDPREGGGAGGESIGEVEMGEAAGMAGQSGQGMAREVQIQVSEDDLRKLHTLLLETQITAGKLVCGNCGHEYAIREGIANFLLPAHLV